MAEERGAEIAPVELYRICRDYVVHEDNLINHRVGWFIQLNSFLIASYTILVACIISSFFPAGQPTVDPKAVQVIAGTVLAAISGIGAISSVVAHRSITAASLAIQSLEKHWAGKVAEKSREALPGLTGGGDPGVSVRGDGFHTRLPVALGVLWLVSILAPASFVYLAANVAPEAAAGAASQLPQKPAVPRPNGAR